MLDVDVHLGLDTGPEAIAGSTRMKAATAQKLVLHSLSTAMMVRLGRTYSNLMVGMVATNAKLRGRLVAILVEATGHAQSGAPPCLPTPRRREGRPRRAPVRRPVASARRPSHRNGGIVRAALNNDAGS